MPEPLALPLRVLVKGSSMVHDISARPKRREHFAISRVIEEQLLLAGHNAVVWTDAAAGETSKRLFRSWEKQVMAWSPDAVVLNFGAYECVHLFLPRWIERYANSLKRRPGPVRRVWNDRVVRPVWRFAFKVQRTLDGRFATVNFGRVRRRVRTDLIEYIRRTRKEGQPLVLVLEATGVGKLGERQFPGLTARIDLMNVTLAEVVAHFDHPDVVLVPAPEIARGLPPEIPFNADGFHYGPELHQAVGEYIAQEIRTWVKDHPRLAGRG